MVVWLFCEDFFLEPEHSEERKEHWAEGEAETAEKRI